MWYKFENKNCVIFITEQLIKINPDLSTDLCAEIVTKSIGLSYWDLLNLFCSDDNLRVHKILNSFVCEESPKLTKDIDENNIGCLLQKKGRKNITNTYFSYVEETLLVSKIAENYSERCIVSSQPVLMGTYLLPKLSELINNNDVEGFESLFIKSIEAVFERFEYQNSSNLLQSKAIDCIAKNTIITDDGFDFFDIEYSPNLDLTKSHFFLRSVLGFHKQYIKRKYWPYKSPYELYLLFCEHFSIDSNVDQDINCEIEFRKTVLESKSKGLLKKELEQGFYNTIPFPVKLFRYLKYRLS